MTQPWRYLRNWAIPTRSHGSPPRSKPIQPEGLGAPGKVISAGLKQALPDEPPLRNPTGTGENPATGMGHELVQHVKLCQLVENLDEASANISIQSLIDLWIGAIPTLISSGSHFCRFTVRVSCGLERGIRKEREPLTAFTTINGRSTLAAGTAVTPNLPFVTPVGTGSGG